MRIVKRQLIHQILFWLLVILSLSAWIYLFYWSRLESFTSSYSVHEIGDICVQDLIAAGCAGLLLLIAGFSLFTLFVKSRYRALFWIHLVFSGCFFLPDYIMKIDSFNRCDMSICNELTLFRDGTFRVRSQSQNEVLLGRGYFYVKREKIILTSQKTYDKSLYNKKDIAEKEIEVDSTMNSHMIYGIYSTSE